jgi:hypothetical protein
VFFTRKIQFQQGRRPARKRSFHSDRGRKRIAEHHQEVRRCDRDQYQDGCRPGCKDDFHQFRLFQWFEDQRYQDGELFCFDYKDLEFFLVGGKYRDDWHQDDCLND